MTKRSRIMIVVVLVAWLAVSIALLAYCCSDGYKAEMARQDAEAAAKFAETLGPGVTPEQAESLRYQFDMLVGRPTLLSFAGFSLVTWGMYVYLLYMRVTGRLKGGDDDDDGGAGNDTGRDARSGKEE